MSPTHMQKDDSRRGPAMITVPDDQRSKGSGKRSASNAACIGFVAKLRRRQMITGGRGSGERDQTLDTCTRFDSPPEPARRLISATPNEMPATSATSF